MSHWHDDEPCALSDVECDASVREIKVSEKGILVDMLTAVREKERENDARIRTMAQMGVVVDADSLTRVRLNTLLDRVLGVMEGEGASAGRLEYEMAVQDVFTRELSALESRARMATLMQGVTGVRP